MSSVLYSIRRLFTRQPVVVVRLAKLSTPTNNNKEWTDKLQKRQIIGFNSRLNYKPFSIGVVCTIGLVSLSFIKKKPNESKQVNECNRFTRKEVSEHNSLDKGVWIIYNNKVYDITSFIKHHPGGAGIIMLGAGGDVEPFWETYTFHKEESVQNLLKSYQIGELNPDEIQKENNATKVTDVDDPYLSDPKRSPLLKVLSEKPFNAETPSKLLIASDVTPKDILFVRNHLPVPEVNIEDYRLEICIGSDGDEDNLKKIAEFSYEDLKTKFTSHTVESVVQCSGNRRSDLKKIKEIKGLDWNVGALGNVKWTGVKLIDILTKLELEKLQNNFKHLQMQGLDCDMSGQCYGASISADIAFNPNGDVLLAYEMNGEPLSRDHGFPIRLIAPGVTGARNVKWLSKLILSNEESTSHWQRNDYKSFSPNVDLFTVDYNQSISIQEMPVQSAICDPQEGDCVQIDLVRYKNGNNNSDPPTIPVKGYAWSGGGKMIVRVDVSVDDGNNWQTAKLEQPLDFDRRNRNWRWTRWSAEIEVPRAILESSSNGLKGTVKILCRAFDSAYNSQPERAETIWNLRGVVNNSWHTVTVNFVINKKTTD